METLNTVFSSGSCVSMFSVKDSRCWESFPVVEEVLRSPRTEEASLQSVDDLRADVMWPKWFQLFKVSYKNGLYSALWRCIFQLIQEGQKEFIQPQKEEKWRNTGSFSSSQTLKHLNPQRVYRDMFFHRMRMDDRVWAVEVTDYSISSDM